MVLLMSLIRAVRLRSTGCFFSERLLQEWFPYSAFFLATADTRSAIVLEAFLEEFHAFLREGRILGS